MAVVLEKLRNLKSSAGRALSIEKEVEQLRSSLLEVKRKFVSQEEQS